MRCLAFALMLVGVSTAHAQGPRFSVQFQAIEFETGSTEKMAAYGLLTGAAGFLVGGLVGAALSGDRDDSDSWVEALEGAVIGGTIGESLMMPVGVHLANDRRGDLLWSMPASLAIGVTGAAIGRRLESTGKAWPILVLTPLAQLVASIPIERNTDN
ncbi:MAG TPA: hypothetical protein VGC44_05170 [Longimicrobiales bacterium]